MPSTTPILDFQRLSPGEVFLSAGAGRTGPDWVALVKNEVTVILDDEDYVLAGGGVRVPDGFAIVGATHSFVSHKGLRVQKREPNLLDDQVAIFLHSDALHIRALLLGVLPLWAAVFIHDNLAIFLRSEFVDAILTPQAVAFEQPLIVTEGVVRHIGGNGGLVSWLLSKCVWNRLLRCDVLRKNLIQEGTWPHLYVAMSSARPPLHQS